MEEAVEEITAFVKSIPKKQLNAVFDEWRRRLMSCIERKEENVLLHLKMMLVKRTCLLQETIEKIK